MGPQQRVARLAGLPQSVVSRAREILTNLEDDEINPTSGMPTLARRNKKAPPPDSQLTLL